MLEFLVPTGCLACYTGAEIQTLTLLIVNFIMYIYMCLHRTRKTTINHSNHITWFHIKNTTEYFEDNKYMMINANIIILSLGTKGKSHIKIETLYSICSWTISAATMEDYSLVCINTSSYLHIPSVPNVCVNLQALQYLDDQEGPSCMSHSQLCEEVRPAVHLRMLCFMLFSWLVLLE